ncbi:hypothetical protein HDU97_001657 [Phlyctochytrium planicorne]|nr:hypothetical protein HDU97_001657 [Phlyctochytrium planicorne]
MSNYHGQQQHGGAYDQSYGQQYGSYDQYSNNANHNAQYGSSWDQNAQWDQNSQSYYQQPAGNNAYYNNASNDYYNANAHYDQYGTAVAATTPAPTSVADTYQTQVRPGNLEVDKNEKTMARPNFEDVRHSKLLENTQIGMKTTRRGANGAAEGEELANANKRQSLLDRSKLRGCLPRSPLFRIICLCVVVAILAVLCVFGYFFWPRFPEIKVLAINDAGGVNLSAYEFKLPADANGNLNRIEIRLNLLMNISVYNANLFDLQVEEINLNAFLEFNRTEIDKARKPSDIKPPLAPLIGPAPVGRDPNYKQGPNYQIGSSTKKSVVFPAKQTKIFEMNFVLLYKPDPQLGLLEDDAFKEFLGVCGITQSRPRPAKVTYDATSTVSFLKSFGYKPSLPGSILIKCPVGDDILIDLQNYSQTHPDAPASEVLEKVFGVPIQISS